jgi:hypothetical protein
MNQNQSLTPLIVIGVVLVTIYVLFIISTQLIVDQCNRKDEFGQLVYKESFICATSHGERITND